MRPLHREQHMIGNAPVEWKRKYGHVIFWIRVSAYARLWYPDACGITRSAIDANEHRVARY
jgi:hypothetical protein